MSSFDIPILLVAFNRPDTAQQVAEAIRKIRPQHLYVAVDGPRPDKPNEIQQCQETQKAILNTVDWDCKVSTLFREHNRGCGLGVAEAISWMLDTEEMGIILEDDCVPNQSFFRFCETLLQHYRHDTRVMHISGFNIQQGIQRGNASYYFSRYPEVWGWATWRRAWQQFDFNLTELPYFVEQKGLEAMFQRPAGIKQRWLKNYAHVLAEDPPSIWDYRWMYSIWKENGLCVTPNVPMVRNVGFDERAVHTRVANNKYDEVRAQKLTEITHPPIMIPDIEADELTSITRHQPSLLKRVRLKVQHLTSNALGL